MGFPFPQFRPIEIKDFREFETLLQKYPPVISEHTFTNIFMWRGYHKFSWARLDDWIVIKAISDGGSVYFWPPIGGGDTAGIFLACIEQLEKEGARIPRIERVPASMVRGVESVGLVATPAREHFDYVYRSNDLIELSGRDFHSKKNHLNKFRKTYSWEYESARPEIVSECMDMQGEWCDLRQCHLDPSLEGEERAIMEALQNIETLKFSGGVIRIDGKIEAFSLGEKLNDNTAVIHIEKANPKIDGLYTAMNQAFVERELALFEFINREQDLGIPGLRKAKLSYNPVRMIDKFVVRRGV